MSRIGKAPVTITNGVEVSIDANNVVTVKGPKGTLTQEVDSAIEVKIEEGEVVLSRPSDLKDHRAKHGLYRSLIFNMIEGVTIGYKKELELVGVGYRAKSAGQVLELALGYSHPIVIELPKEIKVTAETKKGSNPEVVLESHDKQLIGQVAAKIRSLRKPEPYKGKGVRFKGEFIRRKAGKSASK
ncbi:MAG: 50S ribosomal protein L6 [Flavobacteriales bacterium]|nr:50S ribosomal protein L6 [Flavobacteriales bacterium]MDG1781519.1 50S ribosomal protein L6 [Flavobacteriales bacterium]MDG2245300.1 50S ribosomal protein L6 [Flavobacteriales bacterium]